MRVATGILVMVAVSCAAAVALGLRGGLDPARAWIALLAGAAAGAWSAGACRPARDDGRPTVTDWVVLAVFAAVTLRAFLWHTAIKGDALMVLSPNNLGDFSLHVGLIRYLAGGEPFWPENPILSGEPLRYPVGADLFNAILLSVGVGVERGIVWVGLAGGALTAYALWRWGRGFAVAAFLFAGGLAGFVFFRDVWGGGFGAMRDAGGEVAWKNLFLSMFVTQRGLLYALPAGLLLMCEWRRRHLLGRPGEIPAAAQVALYATMPLFNAHAFLFLSALLVGVFAFSPIERARWRLALFAAASFVPATAAAWLVTGGFTARSGFRWQPGWMQGDEGIGFWLWNFGLALPLGAALAAWVAVRGTAADRAVALPSVGIFVACMLFAFAPWEWDNTKLMLWTWIALAPAIWRILLRPLPVAGRWAVCFLLFFSGALSLIDGLHYRHGYRVVSRSLLAESEAALRETAPGARFVAAPEFWHPVILLGRKTAAGYDGHLWSHGLDYGDRMRAVEQVLQGGPGWEEAARDLGARYIFFGEPERSRYPASARPWERRFAAVYRSPAVAVFDLEAELPRVESAPPRGGRAR